MKHMLTFFFSREHRVIRDFTLAGVAMVAIAIGAATALSEGLALLSGREGRLVSARHQPLPPPARVSGETTVVRSVLDDPVMTGSVGSARIVLDPCTGQQRR
jgi:hypothetical protein